MSVKTKSNGRKVRSSFKRGRAVKAARAMRGGIRK